MKYIFCFLLILISCNSTDFISNAINKEQGAPTDIPQLLSVNLADTEKELLKQGFTLANSFSLTTEKINSFNLYEYQMGLTTIEFEISDTILEMKWYKDDYIYISWFNNEICIQNVAYNKSVTEF